MKTEKGNCANSVNDQIISLFNKYYEYVYTTDDPLSRGGWKRLFAEEIIKLFTVSDIVGRSEQLIAFLKWVGDGHDFENNAEKIVKEYIDKGN